MSIFQKLDYGKKIAGFTVWTIMTKVPFFSKARRFKVL